MILQMMSTFPPLSETFVMREVRQLRAEEWDVVIGQLRPIHKTSKAQGFEDLTPFVVPVRWVSLDLLVAFLFFLVFRMRRVLNCLRLVFGSIAQPRQCAKMAYILLSASRLAFRYRNSPVELIRASFLNTEALAARYVGELIHVPYTVTVYTTFAHYPQTIVRDIVRNAAFLIADTRRAAQYLESMGADATSVHVIYNSVDLQQFEPRGSEQRSSPPIILGVGRLDPKKGFDVLITACSILQQRGVTFECVIVGEGSEHARLLALRRRLQLDHLICLPGKAAFEEIKAWYYKATIFAMASIVTAEGDTDGLPTVVVEAMASGLPVVGTDVGGIPEAVRDGVNGFLVPPQEPDLLADRLRVLLLDHELRARFGEQSRRFAESQFDLKRKGEALSSIMRQYLIPRTALVYGKPISQAVGRPLP